MRQTAEYFVYQIAYRRYRMPPPQLSNNIIKSFCCIINYDAVIFRCLTNSTRPPCSVFGEAMEIGFSAKRNHRLGASRIDCLPGLRPNYYLQE